MFGNFEVCYTAWDDYNRNSRSSDSNQTDPVIILYQKVVLTTYDMYIHRFGSSAARKKYI